MNLNSVRDRLEKNIKNFGLGGTIYDLAFRSLNRITEFKILKGIWISIVNTNYLETDPRYRCQFLSQEMLREFAKHPQYEISNSFLDEALAKGDQCYGIIDGDRLAAYGWYSNKPTDISDELRLHFNPEFIYMYKGFTHEDYRGQRLHAIGMNLAMREYINNGFKGLVSYVESNNFSSLKSCYRMGYSDFGEIYLLRSMNRHVIYSSPGCKAFGFFLSEKQRLPLLSNIKIATEVDGKDSKTFKAEA